MRLFNRQDKNKDQLQSDPENQIVRKLAHEPQTALEHYLAYYVGLTEPGYAVLVTGEWGTGKTYQVTKALPASHAYYVSLFGLTTPQEIEAQVFATMFPVRAWTKRASNDVASLSAEITGIGAIGIDKLPALISNIFIKNKVDKTKPIIFDDLERSTIAPKSLLGIINLYVEHYKCRVIVIAHDDKIVKDFQETKEKVFGQVIKIEPDVDAAFENFGQALIASGQTDALGNLKSEVLGIFKESGQKSLRVLRHVMEDANRLLGCLEARHRENKTAMTEMIRMFAALSIEYRTGTISAADLNDRVFVSYRSRQRLAAGNTEESAPAFKIAREKYKSANLTSTVLNDEALSNTLIYGCYISSDICASLDMSIHFAKPEAMPNWQIVINFDELDDDIITPALVRMNDQLERREATNSGEFLHIVALKMMMADGGFSSETVQNVAVEAKAYIDDLLSKGLLPPREPDPRWKDQFIRSHAGFGYWVNLRYEVQFDDVLYHLISAREKAAQNQYPDLIPSLLETVRSSGESFYEKVRHTKNGNVVYEDEPILAYIAPEDFVDAWLVSPKSGWFRIADALNQRRNSTHFYKSLEPEIPWSERVFDELMRRSEAETGLAKLRLVRAASRIGVKPDKA